MTVEREISVQPGVGTVPVDARMTPLAPAIAIGSAGGSLTSGSLNVSIPPGAISSSTNFHLTSLSQQGLPGLLPLGWSPVTVFDLRSDTPNGANFNANFTNLPNGPGLLLVTYDYSAHAWTMVTPNLGAVNGALTIPLPSVGSYALVTPDVGSNSVQVPAIRQPTGVAMVMLPPNTFSSGSLNPASVSPTGGTSLASLGVQSPTQPQ